RRWLWLRVRSSSALRRRLPLRLARLPGPPEAGRRQRGHQLQGFGLLRHRLPCVHFGHRRPRALRVLVDEGLLARGLELSVLELVRVFGSKHSRRELSSITT